MKSTMVLKHKIKAAVLLVVTMALLIINNILGTRSYSNLDKSISSIYQDRLMPATYIFEISDHLYQERLLQEQPGPVTSEGMRLLDSHNVAIAGLITNYEKTYLTKDEVKHWSTFKKDLQQYQNTSPTDGPDVEVAFDKVMGSLKSLSQLQVGEGSALTQDAQTVISGRELMSQLEMSLLVIMGMVVVFLIATPEKLLVKDSSYSLN